MNKAPLRLGPAAILMLVITIALSSLAVLTVTTSRADLVMAQRLAQTVQIRYRLESKGYRLLEEVKEDPGKLNTFDEISEEGIYVCHLNEEGYTLTIGLEPESLEIRIWQIEKDWQPEAGYDLWSGE